MFIDNVWELHGLPDSIVSDRGPQFVSEFWNQLCACLQIEPQLSTAFHPETDGQIKRLNAVMEEYLRSYVSYQQDDWVSLLPMAEFTANNHASETTNTSPFFGNYGYHPQMSFSLPRHGKTIAENRAHSTVKELSQVHKYLRGEMKRAQMIHEENAN